MPAVKGKCALTPPSIDRDHLPGNVPAIVRRQHRHHTRNVAPPAQMGRRSVPVKHLQNLGIVLREILIDGFAMVENRTVEEHRPALDILAEIGATRVNTASFDFFKPRRTIDDTAKLVERAATYDGTVAIEPCQSWSSGRLPKRSRSWRRFRNPISSC